MKNVTYKSNINKEKFVITSVLSLCLAILFDGKRKKPKKRKSFIQRFVNNFMTTDRIFSIAVTKDNVKKQEFKTKLKDLEIENAEFIDI